MSISEQVKELRSAAEVHKNNSKYMVNLLNSAAGTIETLSAKLEKMEKQTISYNFVCEKILQDIREKIFSVDVADFYTESAVLFDDVEEIINSAAKESMANMDWSERYYNSEWIMCEDRLPDKMGRYYIVSVKSMVSDLEYTRPALYDKEGFATKVDEEPIAWQPLPLSYKPNKE